MRIKTFIIIFCSIVITSYLLVVINSSAEDENDSLKLQLKEIHENAAINKRKLEADSKYLILLGYTTPIVQKHHHKPQRLQIQNQQQQQQHQQQQEFQLQQQYNGSRANFSIVSYILNGQAAAAIMLIQNVAAIVPNETLLLYDIGLSDDDSHALNTFCNNTKCSLITYDLSQFPSHISDEHMHAFRPLLIKDALLRSKSILFIENNVRIRGFPTNIHNDLIRHANESGVLGWATRQAVSSRTHPKMFEYFQTDSDNFIFLPMVSMDVVLFIDSHVINENILLPWIECALTLECIHPIGAQSNGCRYNKKPQYRYSGCHAYDVSAFNIVLGIQWNFDESKYSLHGESPLFYVETLEQATKILENKRKNISDTSEHPFLDE